MEKPMVAKIVGIITIIQLVLSIIVGFVGSFRTENTGGTNGGYMILIMILISMIIMITASVLLLVGHKYGRILYLIGVILTVAGNITVAGVRQGLLSSTIPLLFLILLYTVKSSREYYKQFRKI
jgi:hypothetical protein